MPNTRLKVTHTSKTKLGAENTINQPERDTRYKGRGNLRATPATKIKQNNKKTQ